MTDVNRILLLGSTGMLGQAICYRLARNPNAELVTVARHHADFTFDACNDEALQTCFYKVRPSVVINAAAIVSLDYCEQHPADAYLTNARLCGIIVNMCRKYHAYLVQISTDHYYDDAIKKTKHDEKAPVLLLNEYARTKYAAELFALSYEFALVLRTNIVGFRGLTGRPTFVEWALQEVKFGRVMQLFNDFYTSPIAVQQFATILEEILPNRLCGLFNLASCDVVSKKEFIIALAKAIFGIEPKYQSVSVRALVGCLRARSLGLDTSKLERVLGYKMPNFSQVIAQLAKEAKEREIHGL